MNDWTIAYRTGTEPVFHRLTDWSGSWQQAHDRAGDFAAAHPDVTQVYYVPTRAAELTSSVCREDVLNVLLDDGTRIPIADDAAACDHDGGDCHVVPAWDHA